VYYDHIDNAEHIYGVFSEETKKEVKNLSEHLKKDFLKKLTAKTAENTGIFFTADHGLGDCDLKNATLLNDFSLLTKAYQLNSKGKPILPSGSPRDIFLHIKEDKLNEVLSFLSQKLKDKSEVLRLDEKTIKVLFGDFAWNEEFIARLGNVLILSKGSHVCWYRYNAEKKLVLKGHHGSLLESDMIIPFGSAKISSLL
jgi:predicted AlkP superfamily pyrophosphatase or phosphodiesterase